MKTNLFYALAALFIFAGCTKDTPRPNPEPEKTYLLQRKASAITLPNGSNMTIDLTYLYNQDNKLTMIEATSTRGSEVKSLRTDLTYNDRGKVHRITDEAGTVWTHHYDNLNELVRLVKTDKDNNTQTYVNTFNTLGRLVEQKIYNGEVNNANYAGGMQVSYGKADFVSVKRVSATGEVYDEANVRTDDRRRPLPILPAQISLSLPGTELSGESLFTENNIVSFENTNSTSANAAEGNFTAIYNYNEAGYPVSSVKTFANGVVENTTYIYTVK